MSHAGFKPCLGCHRRRFLFCGPVLYCQSVPVVVDLPPCGEPGTRVEVSILAVSAVSDCTYLVAVRACAVRILLCWGKLTPLATRFSPITVTRCLCGGIFLCCTPVKNALGGQINHPGLGTSGWFCCGFDPFWTADGRSALALVLPVLYLTAPIAQPASAMFPWRRQGRRAARGRALFSGTP